MFSHFAELVHQDDLVLIFDIGMNAYVCVVYIIDQYKRSQWRESPPQVDTYHVYVYKNSGTDTSDTTFIDEIVGLF